MEQGEVVLDLELMDRIDLHDPTAVVCAARPAWQVRPQQPWADGAPSNVRTKAAWCRAVGLGSITKQGNRYLRWLLVVGAMAVIRCLDRFGAQAALDRWQGTARLRPERNASQSPISATRAVATIGPTPGISSSRRLSSHDRCQAWTRLSMEEISVLRVR